MASRSATGIRNGRGCVTFLVDTHALLWARSQPNLLSAEALSLFGDPDSVLYVSLASLWECAIKSSIGKLTLPAGFYASIPDEYELLGIDLAHIEACERLPLHHRDPFDRMLVAQARVMNLTILTRDRNITRYDVAVLPA